MQSVALLVAKKEKDAGIWLVFRHDNVNYDVCLRGWSEYTFRTEFLIREDADGPDDFDPDLKCLPLPTLLYQ